MKEYIPKILRKTNPNPRPPINRIVYGIGEQHGENEIGMWKGPVPNLEEMLETVGKSEKSCIIEFRDNDSIRHPDFPISTIIWKWKEDRWIHVQYEEVLNEIKRKG